MRHLLGLLLAVGMAAAIFFAATWGLMRLTASHGMALTSPHAMAALGAVAGTGLLLGLLMCVRWVSPLATGLPGLVLLAWTAALVARSQTALRYIPLKGQVYGSGFQMLLLNGVLALLGLAMVIPLFVPSRWHRYHEAAMEDEDEDEMLSHPATTSATSLLS